MSGPPFDDVLVAAQTGEAWAVARLYEDLKGPVVTFARLRGAADPDDVTSETFLQVFRDLPRFTGDESGFRAWVFTIARRRLLDERRRASRRVREVRLTPGIDAAGGDTAEEALASLGDDRIRTLLAGLTVDQREVVLLRIVADLSLKDTAAVTGRSVGAVKILQHRALAALRGSLVDPGVSP
ncbi:MAG: RNA polymerase sigma factor [Actinobacteria bacterium]|nr:RNA polymerase sigma factor [Actinomycetota bacterium]